MLVVEAMTGFQSGSKPVIANSRDQGAGFMTEWFIILLVFVVISGVLILVAVLVSERLKAGVKLPGRAEFYIDAERGWNKRPDAPSSAAVTSTQDPDAYLEMKLQHGSNWVYSLEGKRQVYIGRREDNDLRLKDRMADGRQAVIYWEEGRFKINNLSAVRPTLVNGKPITKQNLGDGNTIQLGNTKLIFRDRRRVS